MKQQGIFLIFCSILVCGLMQAFSAFQFHFSGLEQYKAEVVQLKEKIREEQLHTALVSNQLTDFKQSVAASLPELKVKNNYQKEYQVRNIASIVGTPAEILKIDSSNSIFEKAKAEFREQKYEEAVAYLQSLNNDYPQNTHAVEVNFLLAESFYLDKKYADSLKVVDTMMTQFPENDLTGFILLRMGQIFEYQNRDVEAQEVYQTVLKKFPNPELQKQAKKLLRSEG